MPGLANIVQRIFNISKPEEFNGIALEIFHYQYQYNKVYGDFVNGISINTEEISDFAQIPFLPISFFKTRKVVSRAFDPEVVFCSSGTTGSQTSKHFVKDLTLYHKSFFSGFSTFFGNVEDYTILGLLPSYLERDDSSLVYMVQKLMEKSKQKESGFFLNEYKDLKDLLTKLRHEKRKVILFGVTYALLDFADQYPLDFPELILIETGGMKGQRKEMVREEVHELLKEAFQIDVVCSEYGMTELLSQAYSKGDGLFKPPPWMKVLIRDPNDPMALLPDKKTGGVNVIDLANIYSCSFIATQDLGKVYPDGRFEVLGRFDNSDVRGCSLLV